MAKKLKPVTGSTPTRADDRVFYGPYPCELCGKLIAKASDQNGVDSSKEVYDYPEGPVYPNSIWNKHVCPDLTEVVKDLKARVSELEAEVVRSKEQTIILEILKESIPNKGPSWPQPGPIWMDNPNQWKNCLNGAMCPM